MFRSHTNEFKYNLGDDPVILIHKKLSDIQVPNPSDNVTSKVMLMSVIECEC